MAAELTSPGAAFGSSFRDALLQQAMLKRQAALDLQEQQKTQEQLALTAQQRATQKETADALAQDRLEKAGMAAIGQAADLHQPGEALAPAEATSMLALPATAPLVTPAPAPNLSQKMAAVLPPENTVDTTGAPVAVAQPTATFKGTEKQRLDATTHKKLQDIADGNFELPEGTDPTVKSSMMVDAHLRLAGMPALAAGVMVPKQPKTAVETSAEMDNEAQKLYTKRSAHAANVSAPALTPDETAKLAGYEARKGATATAAEPFKKQQTEEKYTQDAIKFAQGDMNKTYAPLLEKGATVQKLKATLAIPGGVADAVASPEFLSVMAGGFGTGLRMNNAELTRINNAQPIWSRLIGMLSAWNPESADPEKQKEYYPRIIQPAMRAQMEKLAQYISDRAESRLGLYKEYRDKIARAKTSVEAYDLKSEFDDKQAAAIFNPPSGGSLPALPILPSGAARPFDPSKSSLGKK